MNEKILYISYDGMTDPLGQSQVLPYLIGLSKEGYQFTILSFEKKEKYKLHGQRIRELISRAGIRWVPLRFTTKPPYLSKFIDALKMRYKVLSLYKQYRFDMIHCRSYIASTYGLLLKHRYGAKFLFDMRGFWADEKKDGGAWDQHNFLFRKVYKYYKRKEALFVNEADYIISLTEAGKKEIMKWPAYHSTIPISVIPCCADMDHFTLTTKNDQEEGRKKLGLPARGFVLSYLGSVGSWYMLDEMLDLFSRIKLKYPEAKFLFITHSAASMITSKLEKYGIKKEDIMITEASREDVPCYTKASDMNISFIKPVYSKLSSSPTKLGEVLLMGIPVIVNSGVGDVETIVERTGAGIVLRHFTPEDYQFAISKIEEARKKIPSEIREKAEETFSLVHGIASYKKAYTYVLSGQTQN
jgi:glycosyltransferase involved in cell wall biosynthesis